MHREQSAHLEATNGQHTDSEAWTKLQIGVMGMNVPFKSKV
jgi:hypothetical protein